VASTLKLKEGLEPFPGHRLEKLLGSGGWGEVWKASRPEGGHLALKFIPCGSQSLAAQELRALQAIRQIKHPNLIHIEQVWSCSGFIVIGMELADGSLLDLVEICEREFQAPIAPEQACQLLSQVACALDFLNTRQHTIDGERVAFRHCDVKPSNILLRGSQVKLADFSLAVRTAFPLGHYGRVGTLSYVAPEVFQGNLSQTTDQYSLAVTYCQVRGGQFPFADTPVDFTSSYVRPEPDLTMLPPNERPIIARALAPVPQDRWPSCGEMMRRLTQCHRLVRAAV